MDGFTKSPGYFLPEEAAAQIAKDIDRHLAEAVRMSEQLGSVVDKLDPLQQAAARGYIQRTAEAGPLTKEDAAFSDIESVAAAEINAVMAEHVAISESMNKSTEEVLERLTPAQKAIALDHIRGYLAAEYATRWGSTQDGS